ncbi:MAG: formyltransferase [Syntrophobacterales bacterium]|nr:formyltransferase [Syntrophobacterales bacterium]
MKTVVFAYHNMGIVGLEALKRHGFTVEAVFSHRDDPEERVWFASVADWAAKNGIPCYSPDSANVPEWVERIRKMAPDVIFSFYYRNLLKGEILRIPPSGAFNLHGSLLPAYRGRCPVNWVLVRGEKKTGVTLHHMVEKADAGDIVGQKEVSIDPEDSAFSLFNKLCAAAGGLLDDLLPLIKEGRAPRIPQDPEKATYFGGRRPEDGRVDWSWPVVQVYDLIRAVTEPYPGAFTFLPEGKLLIWWAWPETGDFQGNGTPGRIVTEGQDVFVEAGEGRLKLMDVEVEGLRLRGRAVYDYFKDKRGVVLR